MDSPDPHRRRQHGRPGGLEHVQRAQVTNELFHQTPCHRRYYLLLKSINPLTLQLILKNGFQDLSVGVISVLTDIVWKITVAWHAGNIACKVIRFSQVGYNMVERKLRLYLFTSNRYVPRRCRQLKLK